MILDHGNALIFLRKSFLPTVKARPDDPSNFFDFDFKGKFARFKFSEASAIIANNRSIFRVVNRGAHSAPG